MMVEWREIPGYEGRYWASSDGQIKNKHGRIMVQTTLKGKPYLRVGLYSGSGAARTFPVHVIICTTFHGPKPSFIHQVRHRDNVPTNNAADNVLWGTPKENQADRVANGTAPRGEGNGRSALTVEQVKSIKQSLKAGVTITSLAKTYGVCKTTISRIKSGIRWVEV